jgi:hypothetical protein
MTQTMIQLQAKTTITSPTAATGQDISPNTYGFVSGYLPDAVLYVRVYGLDAGDTATIQIDSSVNSFSSFITHQSWSVSGPIGANSPQSNSDNSGDASGNLAGESTAFPTNPVNFSATSVNVQGIPWGKSGATLRVNVSSLTGSSPHLTYESWLLYTITQAFPI